MGDASRHAESTELTTAPVGRTLLRLTVPMAFGSLAMVTLNLVDTFFVGQLGANELAAMAFTFPVVFMVMGVSAGIAIGAGATISRAIGRGHRQDARVLTTTSLLLAIVVAATVSLVGWLTVRPVFSALGASENLLPLVEQYMRIWYFGSVFVVVPMVGNGAIRATGNTNTPSRMMVASACLNGLLDPLLIFGPGPFPRLELAGAAVATVIAYAVSFVAALWILWFHERLLMLPRPRELLLACGSILVIAAPAALTAVLSPLAAAWLTYLAARHGAGVVAALGVVARVEALAMTGIRGLSVVLIPFMGQNLGAGQHRRILEGYWRSLRFSLIWGGLTAGVLAVAAQAIASAFTADPQVQRHIIHLLWLVPWTYGFGGWLLLAANAANGLARPGQATLMSAFRLVVAMGLFGWLGVTFGGPFGLFAAMAVGNVVAGVFAVYRFRVCLQACH